MLRSVEKLAVGDHICIGFQWYLVVRVRARRSKIRLDIAEMSDGQLGWGIKSRDISLIRGMPVEVIGTASDALREGWGQ